MDYLHSVVYASFRAFGLDARGDEMPPDLTGQLWRINVCPVILIHKRMAIVKIVDEVVLG